MEETGIRAIWDNSQFAKGSAEYISTMAKASQATTATATTAGASAGSVAPLASAFQMLGGAAGASISSLLGVLGPIIAIVGTAVATFNSLSQLTDGLKQVGEQALQTASRVQQLNYIAQTVGQIAGYSSEEVNGFVDSVRSQGIAMTTANTLVIQFARYNLDMAKAVDLARVAQDAATIANMGSSEALDGLIHGITTLNVRVLRTYGIMVNSDEAFKNFAASVGKSTEQLTEQERVQAFVNAVVAAGIPIQGAYKASMETAGKVIGTLESRLIPDLLATLGAPFQTAYFNAVTAVANLVKWFTALVSEGGALYPILINLGAVASIITEAFGTAVGAVQNFASALIDDFVGTISDIAGDMYNWGVNLVTNFAKGLINAAASAITAAINYISNLLSSWFSPGSPPKVAKDIDIWGAETMNEYLKGFSEADYDLLDSLQGPIKSALNTLVDLGELTGKQASMAFVDLSQQMIEAIQAGEFTDELYQNISDSLGDYGTAVVDLAKKQFELTKGVDAVTQAEAALAEARKRSQTANIRVNKAMIEYNRLLRAGATAGTLQAKMEEIDAAKQAAAEASTEVSTAETNLDVAKETLKVLQAQAAAQEKLVETMLELAQAAADATEEEEAAAEAGGETGGAEAGGGGAGAGFEFDASSIVDKVKEAVEAAKQHILEVLGGVWETLKGIWDQKIVPMLESVWNAIVEWVSKIYYQILDWLGLTPEGVSEIWENIKQIFFDAIQWIIDQVEWFVGVLKQWWEEHGDSVKTILTAAWGAIVTYLTDRWNYIKTIAGIIWEEIKLVFSLAWQYIWGIISVWVTSIYQTIVNNWDLITQHFTTVWESIKTIFQNALDLIGNIFDLFAALLKGDWETVWSEIQQIFTNVWEIIKALWDIILSTIQTNWALALDFISNYWTNAWTFIQEFITTALTEISEFIMSIITPLLEWINTQLVALQDFFAGIWEAIQLKITEVFTAINDWLQNLLSNLFEAMGLDLDEMKARWSAIWDDVKAILQKVWELIVSAVTEKINTVMNTISTVITAIQTTWGAIWDSIYSKLSDIWTTISNIVTTVFDGVSSYISGKLNEIVSFWSSIWDSVSSKISEVWAGITSATGDAAQSLFDTITGKVAAIWDTLQGYLDSFYSWGANLIQGAVKGVLSAVGSLIDAVVSAIEQAIAAAKAALGMESPSKVFAEIGEGTMEGAAVGIKSNASAPEQAVTSAMMGTVARAAAIPIVAGAQTRNASFNFGGVTMQSPIDLAVFEATIRRVVKSEMGAI